MADEIILHHYDTSPFSEKVRLLLGLKGLAWSSVIQPTIMPKPLSTQRGTSARTGELIASAVRTLEVEATGINTLSAAIHDGLGRAFIAAVDLISGARGRLIVTGMGKSGHVGRKIAATFASTGTPAFFVHPSEASHGDLGMITPDDVIMALSWSGQLPGTPMQSKVPAVPAG